MKKQCFAFLTGLLLSITAALAQTAAGLPTVSPLFIVDSTIIDNLDYLPPEDIESVTILKGKEAVALYGSRGAGGVVVVHTKDSRQYLSAEDFLALHQIKLTPYTVLMLNDRLIPDPWRFRIDTSQIVRVTRSTFHNLSYLDTASKNLQLIKIYTKTVEVNRPEKPAGAPAKNMRLPANPHTGFKNLQTIRSAGSRLIYIQRYWLSNGKKLL
ncbi:TonB-dependent receptor plug domain-containing protein [Niabella hirudinis]|uniref:TonB-dependent receptor plug domain-containing protein n=1 Tax=Niabella hirudinis TaxID=1285929 RepID=UPI003EBBAEB5